MIEKQQFKGLWAIILGGSSGLGFAAVERLATSGMNIAVLYRELSAAEQSLKIHLESIAATNSVTILPYNINALHQASIKLFIDNFSAVNGKHCIKLLLHSISKGNLKPLVVKNSEVETDDYSVLSAEDIQLTTYAMSTSLLDWTRALLQAELFNGDGRIIGLTSEGAHKHWESYAAVAVAKASLETLAGYMAVEFGVYGLKTNVIQAGITETASLKKIPGNEKLIEAGAKRNPLGRLTTPADVAGVIYLLCTDDSFWINGAIIHADGGEHCR